MTRKKAQQAWEKMRSEIDKENWLFVGTINPQMVDMAIEALKSESIFTADRPRPIDPTIEVDIESGVVPISACEPKAPKTIIYADRVYAERPRGRWHYSNGKPATIGQSFGVICDQCGTESEYCTNFCGECGANMKGNTK